MPRARQFRLSNRRPFRRMLLGCPGCLPAREGSHQRHFGYSGGSENGGIRNRQHRRNRTRRVRADCLRPLANHLRRIAPRLLLGGPRSHQLNRQGPDEGTQYRSSIFYSNDEQKHIAEAYIAQLDSAKVFARPIVTKVVPLQAFYQAEPYHQNYAALHPNQPYIMFNDAPKVDHLRQEFPSLYTGKLSQPHGGIRMQLMAQAVGEVNKRQASAGRKQRFHGDDDVRFRSRPEPTM